LHNTVTSKVNKTLFSLSVGNNPNRHATPMV
jgi:hypothetical protein